MHSKLKGNIGEASVCLVLFEKGFKVFREIGDLSRIDLIAEKEGSLIKIQCKAISPKKGKIMLNLEKKGPNYKYKYQESDIDFFAVLDLESKKVAFVPSFYLRSHKRQLNLRIEKPKNNQRSKILYFDDFLDISSSLETMRKASES